MMLVAVDPGNDTGWARFLHGRLEACGLGVPPMIKHASVIVECPEYRAHDRVNPNVLIELAIKVGRHVERAASLGIAAELVRPSEWKGSVPKKIHQPRICRELDAQELELLGDVLCLHSQSKGHNVVDAVGIGLFHLGRLPR